ncbi:hypothetical protein MHJ63_00585 [Pseudoglutamicibacter albus]|uniref:hypothetical protein n=1 Tax=Pseudoglutamicibacter albus TaxID=98671 RepID=UPI001EF498C9|nr:hypothetical protein [Pseudoglutamicibacter albus]MCG7303787.1 hypothetical protein [Pseudoglutamicibacter albus]
MSRSPMASTWRTDSRAVQLHKSVRVTVGSIVTNLIPTAIVAFFVYTSVAGAAVGKALMYIGIPLGGLIFLIAIGGAVVALVVAYTERRRIRGESGTHVASNGSSTEVTGARIPMLRLWILLVVTVAVTVSRIIANWWFFETNGAGSAARTEVGPGPVVLTSWILYILATVVAFWTFFGVRRYEDAVTLPAGTAGSEQRAS